MIIIISAINAHYFDMGKKTQPPLVYRTRMRVPIFSGGGGGEYFSDIIPLLVLHVLLVPTERPSPECNFKAVLNGK